jgi:hypothetical protein
MRFARIFKGGHVPPVRERSGHVPPVRERSGHVPSVRERSGHVPSVRERSGHVPPVRVPFLFRSGWGTVPQRGLSPFFATSCVNNRNMYLRCVKDRDMYLRYVKDRDMYLRYVKDRDMYLRYVSRFFSGPAGGLSSEGTVPLLCNFLRERSGHVPPVRERSGHVPPVRERSGHVPPVRVPFLFRSGWGTVLRGDCPSSLQLPA